MTFTALPLFNLVDPGLCACGEKLTDEFEIKNGICFFCQADAALGDSDREDMAAEIVESRDVRSRHYKRTA